MSRPALGFHCRLREKSLTRLRVVYRDIDDVAVWKVVAIDNGIPRFVFIDQWGVDGPRRICVWARDLKMFARCKWCQAEDHATIACPTTDAVEWRGDSRRRAAEKRRGTHGTADTNVDAADDGAPAPGDDRELRQTGVLGVVENGNEAGNRGHAA